ncbi:hypothetical protein LSH36_7g03043 [Paralvinella palmiformis]|uniref:Uncharacterized protein n=1 Tax=Paralvinella palmiformis TaxID=53620 RepID=A0AAD9KFB2_9ANNE|nr:hypothetical protein LSH36_7g03043 [Paralvinella palmiformis]
MNHVSWLTVAAVLLLLGQGSCAYRLSTPGAFGYRRHRHGRREAAASQAIKAERRPPGPDGRSKRHLWDCPRNCELTIPNLAEVRTVFQDYLEEPDTQLVQFKLRFPEYNESLLETYPYMSNNYRATEWIWASGGFGRKLLGLPHDAGVLSLYILEKNRKLIDVVIVTEPKRCFIMYSPECRLYAVRDILISNVTYVERYKHHRDFLCHYVINESAHAPLQLLYRCCDTTDFRNGDYKCYIYTSYGGEVSEVLLFINIISGLLTLWSPVFIVRLKICMKFDHMTKFFRASLKHGITGQRNYVIRISSRQLINLSDPKPFSLPRFLFRAIFHCYGEGRCCIHWWGQWRHQPDTCRKNSLCRRFWFALSRFLAVATVYPIVVYLAVAIYVPKLKFFTELLWHVERYFGEVESVWLNVNTVAIAMLPLYHPFYTLWTIFSFISFVYCVLLLALPNNPLERCLLRYDGKRPFEQPNVLYDRMTRGYKTILQRLAYGEFTTKRHLFSIPWIPWGVRRFLFFVGRVLEQIPIVNVCFTMFMLDTKFLKFKGNRTPLDKDEAEDRYALSRPRCINVCKLISTVIIWIGFLLILAGYCFSVFIMFELLLNVVFFTLLGAALHPCTVLPWLCFALVVTLYMNDTLSAINIEHREILKLIDENSPRISAVEDSEEVFREGAVQILKTHNLGAVKFIDGDNTEYVSKELYYNVCTDLKCGWTQSLRRILVRMSVIVLFVLFIFISLTTLGAFFGSGILISLVALILSALPKLVELYISTKQKKSKATKALWAKIMPDILDRHIRVDRTQCIDAAEEELTTYDVRPVGLLEMEVPRMQRLRTLRLWKFPWIVSADQQTQSHETFIVALANKLSAASFLSKIVTRAYSPDLEDETVLRQWCLLVENCIMEGSATASSINGVPVESIRLFPRDVQPLVSPFDTGNTIDNVVDSINRELYGPFTKGVLVTIGNTSIACGKLNDTIFAFNSSCHGDQVTDLFGAVLVVAAFNTQNLQTTIKYMIDPYSPDTVPVYSVVPIEGFVFKSPEILEVDVPI